MIQKPRIGGVFVFALVSMAAITHPVITSFDHPLRLWWKEGRKIILNNLLCTKGEEGDPAKSRSFGR